MLKDKIVKRIEMECPLCERTHEVIEKKRIAKVAIKGETTSYEEHYYYCCNEPEGENEFANASLLNENILRANNAYRRLKGLLTSEEIVAIRNNYALSQVDLAKLLGWGEATISRYESKAIQDDAYDAMLRIIMANPLQALDFLKKNSDKFSHSKYEEIKSNIIKKLDSFGKEYLSRRPLESQYVIYEELSDSNGFCLLNIDKLEAIISYLAEKVSNLFKVKLMKMLWYIDALSYKLNNRSMTGLVYIHEDMGALPVGHNNIMNLENINVREETSLNYSYMLHIYPNKDIDYSILSKEDKQIINTVIKKFKSYSAKEIIDYMHNESAYQETDSFEIIPFSIAGEIREF